MFRGTDLIDQQLAMLGNASDPDSALQHKNLRIKGKMPSSSLSGRNKGL